MRQKILGEKEGEIEYSNSERRRHTERAGFGSSHETEDCVDASTDGQIANDDKG